MKSKKTHKLVVKVGSYIENNETKNRYINIGSAMINENGSFLIIDKTFNPAGVMNESDSILVSMYPVDEERKKLKSFKEDEDEVPF